MKNFHQVFIPLVLLSDFVHTFSFLLPSLILLSLPVSSHPVSCMHMHCAQTWMHTHTQMERGKRQTRCSIKSCMQLTILTINTQQIYEVWGCVLYSEQVFAYIHILEAYLFLSFPYPCHLICRFAIQCTLKKSTNRPLLCAMSDVRHTNTIHIHKFF